MTPLNLAESRKFLAALAGALVDVIALGVLHGTVLHWANVAASALTAVAVYVVPNAHAAPAG